MSHNWIEPQEDVGVRQWQANQVLLTSALDRTSLHCLNLKPSSNLFVKELYILFCVRPQGSFNWKPNCFHQISNVVLRNQFSSSSSQLISHISGHRLKRKRVVSAWLTGGPDLCLIKWCPLPGFNALPCVLSHFIGNYIGRHNFYKLKLAQKGS